METFSFAKETCARGRVSGTMGDDVRIEAAVMKSEGMLGKIKRRNCDYRYFCKHMTLKPIVFGRRMGGWPCSQEHKFSYDQEYHMNLLCKKDTSQIDYDQEIDL